MSFSRFKMKQLIKLKKSALKTTTATTLSNAHRPMETPLGLKLPMKEKQRRRLSLEKTTRNMIKEGCLERSE